MIEKVGHIKNPLTVISVFAGIAEISGTIVLPFIDAQNQATYIWFLMLFPPFLVGIFFGTLNWNHKTLYAPSDYQNEDNFVNPVGKSTSFERVVKLQEEVDEVVSDVPVTVSGEPSTSNLPPTPGPAAVAVSAPRAGAGTQSEDGADSDISCKQNDESVINRDDTEPTQKFSIASKEQYIFNSKSAYERNRLTADIKLTEDLTVKRMTKLTGLSFERDMKILTKDGRSVLFDAAAMRDNHLYALEVKLFRNGRFSLSRLNRTIKECVSIVEEGSLHRHNFTLYLVIVSDETGTIKEEIYRKVSNYIKNFDLDIQFHMLTMEELETEYLRG